MKTYTNKLLQMVAIWVGIVCVFQILLGKAPLLSSRSSVNGYAHIFGEISPSICAVTLSYAHHQRKDFNSTNFTRKNLILQAQQELYYQNFLRLCSPLLKNIEEANKNNMLVVNSTNNILSLHITAAINILVNDKKYLYLWKYYSTYFKGL